jgi:20S proteasome alpha/beta subunit
MILHQRNANTHLLSALILLIVSFGLVSGSSIEGRYSFSLTTFDPSGKLGQVERAMEATSLGNPIIAVINGENEVLLASPQILPSAFMVDDGTARFVSVSPNIVVAHSGISADGRILLAAAQRVAIEHAYTFEEAIPIDLFLEEMSLLFQEYTMKPAYRPFSTTLLVAYLPPLTKIESRRTPQLFRIDPSGSVTLLDENFAIINGKFSSEMESKLLDFSRKSESNNDDIEVDPSDQKKLQSLCQILHAEIAPKPEVDGSQNAEMVYLPFRIIGASLTRKRGFAMSRWNSKSLNE